MAGMLRGLLAARAGLGVPERAGILAGSTSVGRSFSRGLMPRATVDQAVITGVSSTLNYGLTVSAQSLIEAVALKVAGTGPDSAEKQMTQRGVVLVGDVAAMGMGVLAQRALAHRKDEPIARAWGRTFAWRMAVGGMAGAIIVGSDALLAGLDRGRRGWARDVPVALPLGGALAAGQYLYLRRRMVQEGVTHDAEGVALDESQAVSVGRSIAIGTGVSAGLLVAATGERLFAHGVGSLVTAVNPRAELIGRPIGHLAALGLLGAAGYKGLQSVFHKAEGAGDAVESAYSAAPTSEWVSAGPRSEVSLDTIGREGRRFVNMALTVAEIEAVMGGPAKPPIRVFVGLESRATTSERADLAMRELEALGAFERAHIVFMSPTGTGYLNYVTAESLEFLTRGDIALVAMQYSLRPSPLSLGRVGIGIDQNNAFLHALKWRLAAIPEDRRPRLLIFGESLGAQTAEDVFAEEGTAGLHRVGIERGLFLGTPAATRFRQKWLSDPAAMDPDGEVVEVDSLKEFRALPAQVQARARYFLLTHHNDAMPKFWFPLAVQAPDWMGPAETREPGVPKETAWRPYTTFLITFIDVKNAMNVIPGQFVADGHDYRADLARFTSLAYDLPIDADRLEKMERVLRQRELDWAGRRLIGEQLAAAQAQVTEQLAKWGVPKDAVPSFVAPRKPAETDPFAASPPNAEARPLGASPREALGPYEHGTIPAGPGR
ncbi:MAG: alpha/beta-hydrolase family protein [Candidatus Nanopelagicales bacterium]